MNEKIVDIYNLDYLKTDCNYFTIRILFQNNQITNLEIDGETHNKKKIPLSRQMEGHRIYLRLIDIIEDYGFDLSLIGIKINHNINNRIRYISNFTLDNSVYNGQVIIDHIEDKCTFEFNKNSLNGYIQINIYEILPSYLKFKSLNNKLFNMSISIKNIVYNSRFNNEIINRVDNYYTFGRGTKYFRIYSDCFNNLKGIKNKYIKLIELPFTDYNKEGTLQLECYKICNSYYYFVISKIIYSGEIITTTQNTKCDCTDYQLINYVKTDNEFFNKTKMCWCHFNKINNKLRELKILNYQIEKNIFEEKLQLKFSCEINRFFYFQ